MRPLLPLLASVISLGPWAARADDPLEALCSGVAGAHLTVHVQDFQFAGYDSRRGILALRCPDELIPRGSPRAVRLGLPDHRVLLPIGPASMAMAMEATRAGDLQLEMSVRSAKVGRAPERGCGELRADTVALKDRTGAVLAERDLNQPLRAPRRVEASVLVGHINVEPLGAVVPRAVRIRARVVGEACLERALEDSRALNGAMTVELRTSPVGRPERPKVVVDGLVNAALSRCLIRRLRADPLLWSGLGAGARMYLPLYFRGTVIQPDPRP